MLAQVNCIVIGSDSLELSDPQYDSDDDPEYVLSSVFSSSGSTPELVSYIGIYN